MYANGWPSSLPLGLSGAENGWLEDYPYLFGRVTFQGRTVELRGGGGCINYANFIFFRDWNFRKLKYNQRFHCQLSILFTYGVSQKLENYEKLALGRGEYEILVCWRCWRNIQAGIRIVKGLCHITVDWMREKHRKSDSLFGHVDYKQRIQPNPFTCPNKYSNTPSIKDLTTCLPWKSRKCMKHLDV